MPCAGHVCDRTFVQRGVVRRGCAQRSSGRVQVVARSCKAAASEMAWHQMSFVPVEDYRDVVAAARKVFGVEGLVDVADEVQDEFQGFVASAEGVGGVEEEGSLLI